MRYWHSVANCSLWYTETVESKKGEDENVVSDILKQCTQQGVKIKLLFWYTDIL